MANIEIRPSTPAAVGHAVDLFGGSRVVPACFGAPIEVTDLQPDEVTFAKEFFGEMKLNVSEIP